jgi:carboxypeptidase C (cathepsin A)
MPRTCSRGMAAAQRPVMFFYNGGPGSATVWLHLGSFGPRAHRGGHARAAGASALPPGGQTPRRCSMRPTSCSSTPVGSGYSQAVSPYTNQSFWGVDADAALFRDFVRRWLAQNGREAAPKYLYGESYGGPRTAVLASLLETAGVRLAGVVLQSPALDYNGNCGLDDGTPTDCRGFLPSYGAAARVPPPRGNPAQPDLPGLHGPASQLCRRHLPARGRHRAAAGSAAVGHRGSATGRLHRPERGAVAGAARGVARHLHGQPADPAVAVGRYDARFSAASTSQSDPSIAHIDASFYQRPERVPAAGAGASRTPRPTCCWAARSRPGTSAMAGAPCPTRCPTWPPRGCSTPSCACWP